MHTQITRRLQALEANMADKNLPNPILTYDPRTPGAKEAALEKYQSKHPATGIVFLIPRNGRYTTK